MDNPDSDELCDERGGEAAHPLHRGGGVANAKVVIIGAGVSRQNAATIALGMGADVTLLKTDLDNLVRAFELCHRSGRLRSR